VIPKILCTTFSNDTYTNTKYKLKGIINKDKAYFQVDQSPTVRISPIQIMQHGPIPVLCMPTYFPLGTWFILIYTDANTKVQGVFKTPSQRSKRKHGSRQGDGLFSSNTPIECCTRELGIDRDDISQLHRTSRSFGTDFQSSTIPVGDPPPLLQHKRQADTYVRAEREYRTIQ